MLAALYGNPLGGPRVSKDQQARAHASDYKAEQNQSVVPPQGAAVNPLITRPCSQTEPCWTEQASPEEALPRFARAEWVIVYVTVLYSGITWLTLLSIKRQADLMDKQTDDARESSQEAIAIAGMAADAALLNAKAVINAERAWIVISVESPALNKFQFRATNVGKTPARITQVLPRTIVVNRRNELPITWDGESEQSHSILPPQLLPPTASIVVQGCDIEEIAASGCRYPDTIEAARARIFKGFTNVYSRGRILYYDVLATDKPVVHETQWLYWHIPIEGAMPIPDPHRPEYNTYT